MCHGAESCYVSVRAVLHYSEHKQLLPGQVHRTSVPAAAATATGSAVCRVSSTLCRLTLVISGQATDSSGRYAVTA
jgi:hypothetical protein